MIGSLRGTVVERNADSTVLFEVSGIGYLVHVTPRTLAELEPTSQAFMHVYHHIREDAQTLFGFLEKEERVAFDTLIATHGIGPSMAMSILATHSPRALIDIVATNDHGALTLVPGVGKKTAERLLLELKGKLAPDLGLGQNKSSKPDIVSEITQALLALGYSDKEAHLAVRQVPADITVSDGIKLALKSLSKG